MKKYICCILSTFQRRKQLAFVLLSFALSFITLYLAKQSYTTHPCITLSFHQKTSAPVHYAVWYKIRESDDFSKMQSVTEKKAPLEGPVSIKLPISHLHQFRLDFQPVEDADVTLSKLEISNGRENIQFLDLSTIDFLVPKNVTVQINGDSAAWHCRRTRPASKMICKKPVNVSSSEEINYHVFFLSLWSALSGWYFVLVLLLKLLKYRKQRALLALQNENRYDYKSFLPHVEGLRGIAILFVVVFHFSLGNSSLKTILNAEYGYLGVEIFMVIMGYFLIRGFLGKNVDFVPFFIGKVRRLLIPLTFLILIGGIVAVLTIDYEHLKVMADTGISAMLGLSNYELIESAKDYFAISSSMNMLLHTWYVSVAIQLFIISWLGYQILRYFPRVVVVPVLVIVACVSFAFDCLLDNTVLESNGIPAEYCDYLTSYYATVPRVWQLLAGGLVLLLPSLQHKVARQIAAPVGMLIICWCLLFTPSFDAGILSLLVVVGTVLTIKYTDIGPFNKVLTRSPLAWVGKISFSLYLIHMPVVVIYKGYTMKSLDLCTFTELLVLSVILGWAFWYTVEKRKIKTMVACLVWPAAFIFSYMVSTTNGLKDYYNAEINKIDSTKYPHYRFREDKSLETGFDQRKLVAGLGVIRRFATPDWKRKSKTQKPFLQIGCDNLPPTFAVMGDSHSAMTYSGFDTICKEAQRSGVMLNTLVLPFWNRTYGLTSNSYSMGKDKTEALLRWLDVHKEIKTVFFIFSWVRLTEDIKTDWNNKSVALSVKENLKCVSRFVEEVKRTGKHVVMFTPYPRFRGNEGVMYARMLARHKADSNYAHLPEYVLSREQYNKQWREIISALNEFKRKGVCDVIDVAPYFFKNGDCKAIRDPWSISFFDCNHFSPSTSIDFVKSLESDLLKLIPNHK